MRIAIVDLNGGQPNHGVSALCALVAAAGAEPVRFAVRPSGRLPPPGLGAYVLSGGPGSPLAASAWRSRVLAALPAWCESAPVLGVCLGFQLLALAHGWPVRALPAPRFGVRPVRRTAAGRADPLLAGLAAEAAAFEQRRFGVFAPDQPVMGVAGGLAPLQAPPLSGVLAIEADGEVTAARFGSAAGVIFHPEAEPGLVARLLAEPGPAREKALRRHGPAGLARLQRAVPRLESTWRYILPAFLRRAIPHAPPPPPP